MERKKVIVVGGGPAGMMAAIRAAQSGAQVTLIEKNPTLGSKLLLSGKGRCNITNLCDLDSCLKRFSGQGQFLRDSFKKFFNQELIDFFQKRGLKLKTERQQRVFPVTDKSDSVLEVLKKELQKNKVKVTTRAQLKDILLRDKEVGGLFLSDGQFLAGERIILACGGASYAFTGSSGEALDIAAKLGHTIIPLRAGLVPLETRQRYPGLAGLTLKNIRLRFSDTKKEIISEIGELLFTHFGISGPLVLTLSGRIIDWLEKAKHVYAEIDLKPALSSEQVNARLLRDFKTNSAKSVKNTLKELLPQSLIPAFLGITGIDGDKKANQVTVVERRSLAVLTKAFRLDISKPRPLDEGMVTRGGVSLKQVNPRTMESRLIKGLYFAGEMLDLDADTGGFNLQAAFSTGFLAGESAALN
ncbi:MAG: NAD(P)/FAD-dependent oxidoreductase [Candidatus Omnitrophica bacterium]|nr:NAD(P)/FAD-dependent oxidoreductase [Candidatus Omnitrophota bacterium]